MQTQVLNVVFLLTNTNGNSSTPYQIGGFNLLKNNGRILDDQQVHTDYANRIPQ